MRTLEALQNDPAVSPVPIADFRFPFSESDLSRLWQDQTFPPEALITTGGERLRVVYRGRRTGGPGPDFRDALIAAPGGLLRGDVELHVRSSDFQRHGHHHDDAYAGVVLHLVFRDDDRNATGPSGGGGKLGATSLPGGGRARVVALEGWVEGRTREIRRWLERPALWREPCQSAVMRTGVPAVGATLDRLGEMRFRALTAGFARQVASAAPDEALWRALIAALGYGGESAIYTRVAETVSWAGLREAMLALPASTRAATAYALLTAAAGPPGGRARPLRPANRPENRLRGAAVLAGRFAERGPLACLAGVIESQLEPPSQHEARAVSAAIKILTVPRHIGRSRAVELLANAVLPCLAVLKPEARARRAEALYARLPLPARYGAVRHLHEAVGGGGRGNGKWKTEKRVKHGERTKENGNTSNDFRFSNFDFRASAEPGVRVDFRRQQGMLYLLKQHCTQGGCGRCPLS